MKCLFSNVSLELIEEIITSNSARKLRLHSSNSDYFYYILFHNEFYFMIILL